MENKQYNPTGCALFVKALIANALFRSEKQCKGWVDRRRAEKMIEFYNGENYWLDIFAEIYEIDESYVRNKLIKNYEKSCGLRINKQKIV
jgi:hypothetical protein